MNIYLIRLNCSGHVTEFRCELSLVSRQFGYAVAALNFAVPAECVSAAGRLSAVPAVTVLALLELRAGNKGSGV